MNACPACNAELHEANYGSYHITYCLNGDYQRQDLRQEPAQEALQEVTGGPETAVRAKRRQKPARPGKPTGETESGLVRAIVEALQMSGYTVLRVGQWRADYAGSTAGTPDLFCFCPRQSLWYGIEVKTSTGRLSPAQKRLVEAGMVHLIRSPQEAIDLMTGT